MSARVRAATVMLGLLAGLAGSAVTVAAPASAGCEAQVFAQYCDDPIQPDGTWRRCMQSAPQSFSGQYGQIAGFIPPTGRCYPVDPNNFPPTPLGQPQYHIYP